MASGTINLSSNVSGVTGKIEWQSTAYVADNYSLVNVQVYVICSNYGIQGTGAGQWKENGTTVANFSAGVNVPYGGSGTTQVFTKNGIRVNHNENGEGSINLGCDMQFAFAGVSNLGGSETITMDKIDRYPDFTKLVVEATTLETAVIGWDANSEIDAVNYNVNGGTAIEGAFPRFRVYNLEPNTSYKITVNIRRKSSQLWKSKDISVTTKDIARVSSIVNTTVEGTQTIQFTNPSNNEVNLKIKTNNGTLIGTRSEVTSPISITFSNDEKNALYNFYNTTNNATLIYELETTESNSYTSSARGVATITDANPIFTKVTYYRDINSDTFALTGLNTHFIKNASTLQVRISGSAKATPQKGAYIVKYRLEAGNLKYEKEYNDENTINLILEKIPDKIAFVRAIDSRGNITTIQLDLDMVDWEKPILKNFKLARKNGIGTTVNITANGIFTAVDFSALSYQTSINRIVNVKYRKREVGATEWEELVDITNLFSQDTTEGTFENISSSNEIAGFELGKNYEIELYVYDKLGSHYLTTTLTSGESIVCFNKTKRVTGFGKIPDRTLPTGSIDAAGTVNANKITINGVEVKVSNRETIFTGTIKASATSYKYLPNINNYKRIYVYVETTTDRDIVFDIDIENPADTSNNIAKGGGMIIAPTTDNKYPMLYIAGAEFYKNTSRLYFDNMCYLNLNSMTVGNQRNSNYYYIYKIEGEN